MNKLKLKEIWNVFVLVYCGVLAFLYPFGMAYIVTTLGISEANFQSNVLRIIVPIVCLIVYPITIPIMIGTTNSFRVWMLLFLNAVYALSLGLTFCTAVIWFIVPTFTRTEPALFLFSFATLWIAYIRDRLGLEPINIDWLKRSDLDSVAAGS